MIAVSSTLQDQLIACVAHPSRPLPFELPHIGRDQLPKLTRGMGYTKGAEIGVWKGAYSAAFCVANPTLHMLCVDPWVSYPAWVDTKNDIRDAPRVMEAAYKQACARLEPFNATIVRKFSAEAASDVPDRSLDFAYIDGNHVAAAVLEDVTLWAPKVRAGGFVAGHDFRSFPHKPSIQVIEAVLRYTFTHQIDPWFVLARDRTPSFLWVVH